MGRHPFFYPRVAKLLGRLRKSFAGEQPRRLPLGCVVERISSASSSPSHSPGLLEASARGQIRFATERLSEITLDSNGSVGGNLGGERRTLEGGNASSRAKIFADTGRG